MRVRVQEAPFAIGAETDRFAEAVGQSGAGGIVTFSGLVRDTDCGTLERLEIEHYPGMTERAISDMRDRAIARWRLTDALVIHRFGPMRVTEPIMMVATAAPHRADAFQAAEFLMDYLKTRAPFWKKEVTSDSAEWVAARTADDVARDRWG